MRDVREMYPPQVPLKEVYFKFELASYSTLDEHIKECLEIKEKHPECEFNLTTEVKNRYGDEEVYLYACSFRPKSNEEILKDEREYKEKLKQYKTWLDGQVLLQNFDPETQMIVSKKEWENK